MSVPEAMASDNPIKINTCETVEIDCVNIKEEYYDFDPKSDLSDFQTKCGEIFTNKINEFLLICVQCSNTYYSMASFGLHCTGAHQFSSDLLEDVDSESKSIKAEVSSSPPPSMKESEITVQCEIEHFDVEDCKESIEQFDESTNENQSDVFSNYVRTGKDRSNRSYVVTESDQGPIFTCSVCTKIYVNISNLYRHNCQAIRKSRKIIKKTIKPSQVSEAGDPKLFCEICKKQFSISAIFRKHALETHESLPKALLADPYYMKCFFCDIDFQLLKDWREHERKHRSSDGFKCLQCSKIFDRPSSLQMHVNTHTGRKPFQCDQCTLSFAHIVNLQSHVKRVHMKLTPYSCKICSKQITTRTELNVHMRHHTGERPYQCEICGKKFRLRKTFTNHQSTHQTEKNVKCAICPAAFHSKKLLSEHIKGHANKRAYMCNICGSTFNRRANLRTHKQLHATEKRFACRCGKAFAQSAGLYSHRKHCGSE